MGKNHYNLQHGSYTTNNITQLLNQPLAYKPTFDPSHLQYVVVVCLFHSMLTQNCQFSLFIIIIIIMFHVVESAQ